MTSEYAETAVLAAVMDGDEGCARIQLEEFLPFELRVFAAQVRDLLRLVENEMTARARAELDR